MTYLPNKRVVFVCLSIVVLFMLERYTQFVRSSVIHLSNYNLQHEAPVSSFKHKQRVSDLPRHDSIDNDRETIHIVTTCSGGRYLITLTTFLKSLLFFRTDFRIHFHIMTNSDTKLSIDTLLSTWHLKDFNFTTYVRPDKDPNFSWIPYSHEFGHFGYQKLIVADVLPANVDKVIFYDVDVVLVADISELWQEFAKFSPTQAIGMAYETQFWYNTGRKEAWPALEWGYNGGLLLLDLHTLRNIPFKEMYTKFTKEMLEQKHQAFLAEQDIFNYLFVRNPDILYTLPCYWNVQFGDRLNPEACKVEKSLDIKALHTTIPKLDDAKKISRLPVYKDIVNTFNNMKGNRFSTDTARHRILRFKGSEDPIEFSDVTLVVQVTANDWKLFNQFLLKWKGIICLLLVGDDSSVEIIRKLPVRSNVSYYYIYLNEGEKELQSREMKEILSKSVSTERYIVANAKDDILLDALWDFQNNNIEGKWRNFLIEHVKQ